MSETFAWLNRLYGASPGYFSVVAFHGGRPKAIKWFETSELEAAAKTIIATGKRADVYVSVATHEAPPTDPRSRGGEKSVISIPGFWADLDIGEEGHKPAALPNPANEEQALSIVDGLPAPSLLMHSGGGLQAFWLFDEPWVFHEPIDQRAAKQASKEWHALLEQRGQNLGLHVDKTHSLDRILRVPGTGNHKTGESRPVVARVVDGPSMPRRELAALGLPEDEYEPSEGSSTVDNFPLTWADILEPHGWTRCGENLWSRPGKSCSEGHSATTDPYGVPVLVNFSASSDLPSGEGQKLTKLRVWAHLNYGGDIKAAKAALKKMVPQTMEDWAKVAARFTETRVDWETLWTEEESEPDWLLEPLIERGRQIAIYSNAKSGKSLLLLEIALGLATGRELLGNRWARADKPLNVLYVDQENTKHDIRIRAGKMGYEGEVITHLHYYSFPSLAFLDTDRGGIELHALARYHSADLVVIDTLSRVIEGEENSNDTFNNFYKYTGIRLKADGITLVRLDHSGKDVSKGMRGGSSKETDVDEIWQLVQSEDNVVQLTRTHSRSHHGEGLLVLSRRDEPTLRHVPLDYAPNPNDHSEDQVEMDLFLRGVPEDAGWQHAWKLVTDPDIVGQYGKWPHTQRALKDAQIKRRAGE